MAVWPKWVVRNSSATKGSYYEAKCPYCGVKVISDVPYIGYSHCPECTEYIAEGVMSQEAYRKWREEK